MPFTSDNSRTQGPNFIFVGEHPAIDFANTLSNPHGQLEDLLRTWPDLVYWFSEAGLSKDPSLNLSVSRGVEALKSVLKLRHVWKALLAQLIVGGKVSDEFLTSLNSLLKDDNFHDTVRRDSKNGFQLVRSASQLHGEKLALAILAVLYAGGLLLMHMVSPGQPTGASSRKWGNANSPSIDPAARTQPGPLAETSFPAAMSSRPRSAS